MRIICWLMIHKIFKPYCVKIIKAVVFLKCRLLQYFGGILRVKYIRFKGQAAVTEVKD